MVGVGVWRVDMGMGRLALSIAGGVVVRLGGICGLKAMYHISVHSSMEL